MAKESSAVEKGPIGYGSAHPGGTSKADAGAAWRGPAEVARAGNDRAQLRRMHAWVDSDGDPVAKSSYKLPHHRADGTLVLRGARAAIGALLGARGGVDIPAGDRRGVYNHLARHVREFDAEPPAFVQRAFEDDATEDEIRKARLWAAGPQSVEVRKTFELKKYDDERGQAFGWASVSEDAGGNLVFDGEEDAITPDELEKGAYAFVRNARVASDSHDPATIGVGTLIESMFFSKEKQELLGISVPVGWWVGFQIHDDDLRASLREEGGHSMFSIGGMGARKEIA